MITQTMDKTQVRDAATVIVHRAGADGPEILMGQRGANAVFMPNKFVFPGGAVDPGDADIPLLDLLAQPCRDRLGQCAPAERAPALVAAAIRELWEETGLVLGAPGPWPDAPADWQGFAARGYRPTAASLRFVFRAITPPGRPRRFDARFFLTAAKGLSGDINGFSDASDELTHLQWVPITQARSFDLAFITKVVLAEVEPLLTIDAPPASVPFVENDDPVSTVKRLV
ncbi:NUDIX hydrolase [Actibacterium sp. 188UL27-1]|uniref:NUDIX hydrolase n=1 Tax=Actibacterium sp. 188UL27-1 TaxID=2786961 RepID=UPI0019563346|nr:NUDIX hydrolase [Actibacterium sp. 188UL27-1]MBM7069239.1 NUDIX hydrolase [Actibacterium sp. 188UL27-1]